MESHLAPSWSCSCWHDAWDPYSSSSGYCFHNDHTCVAVVAVPSSVVSAGICYRVLPSPDRCWHCSYRRREAEVAAENADFVEDVREQISHQEQEEGEHSVSDEDGAGLAVGVGMVVACWTAHDWKVEAEVVSATI